MAEPLLLTYNLSPDAFIALHALCGKLGIRYRPVKPAEYALPVGALAGIPVAANADSPTGAAEAGFDDGMLVLCHMLSDQLDALLEGLRQSGPRVALKAVLTPSNVAWSSYRLHAELAREHAALRRR